MDNHHSHILTSGYGVLIVNTELLKPEKVGELEVASPIMSIMHLAIEKGAGIDQLERLMAMQERWEANEAKKAFNVAMAKFKENPPKITKDKHVRFQTQKGVTEYDHSTLGHVCDQITAGLSAVGITHKWVPKQAGGKISVTCVLTHALGYSDPEPPTLEASADESGSKNAIQAIGSTVTYLQRYTLLSAVGMASGLDVDGATPEAKGMSQEEFDRYMGLISEAPTVEALKQKYFAALQDARDANDSAAARSFTEAKEKRKKELA